MPYNGLYFGLEERMSMGLIAQCTEFFHQQGATLDPSFKGFHSTVWGNMRTVKRGQFGLGVRANIKHKNKFWGIISILKDTNFPPLHQRIDDDFHRKTDIFGQYRTNTDNTGQIRTLRLGEVLSLHYLTTDNTDEHRFFLNPTHTMSSRAERSVAKDLADIKQ